MSNDYGYTSTKFEVIDVIEAHMMFLGRNSKSRDNSWTDYCPANRIYLKPPVMTTLNYAFKRQRCALFCLRSGIVRSRLFGF